MLCYCKNKKLRKQKSHRAHCKCINQVYTLQKYLKIEQNQTSTKQRINGVNHFNTSRFHI